MFRKKTENRRFIDMHCHILPGIDDGSKDMEETMAMLRQATDEGITEFIVTPHYKHGRRNAGPKTIHRLIEEVQEEAKKRALPPIVLYPGQEVFYFADLAEKLEEEDPNILTMNDTECVLVEFMPGERYSTIRNAIDDIRGSGYIPILAHAERCECLVKDWKLIEDLRQLGCEIQINAPSITGALGGTVKKFTHKLLSEQLVDYIGTDAHDAKRRTPSIQKCMDRLYKKYDREYVDAILYENAKNLL